MFSRCYYTGYNLTSRIIFNNTLHLTKVLTYYKSLSMVSYDMDLMMYCTIYEYCILYHYVKNIKTYDIELLIITL